jgi:cell filamentation protein, protein adenylyltransferase
MQITKYPDRSGQYIKQLQGYKAFIPEPLPPKNPELSIDDELQDYLSEADISLGRLDGSIQMLPNPDLFIEMYVKKEAVISSQIEGTQSSLSQLLKKESEVNDPDAPSDVNEVSNYVKAMHRGLELLNDLPVSVRLVKEIHKELLRDVRGQEKNPGELRKSQNWIGSEGRDIRHATFVPPPEHEMVKALSDWEKFLHQNDHIPVLVKIGMAHAQFETIHPFLDGNGRVGRLLITLLLCEWDKLQEPVLYLSHFFKQHRQEYYELLQNVRDLGDWESWIKFFVRGVSEVSGQATDTSREIVSLREKHRGLIVEEFGNVAGNGLKVLERLFLKPYITVKQIESLTGVTFSAANNLMGKFENVGVLTEITGQKRNRQYEYSDYLNLFSAI